MTSLKPPKGQQRVDLLISPVAPDRIPKPKRTRQLGHYKKDKQMDWRHPFQRPPPPGQMRLPAVLASRSSRSTDPDIGSYSCTDSSARGLKRVSAGHCKLLCRTLACCILAESTGKPDHKESVWAVISNCADSGNWKNSSRHSNSSDEWLSSCLLWLARVAFDFENVSWCCLAREATLLQARVVQVEQMSRSLSRPCAVSCGICHDRSVWPGCFLHESFKHSFRGRCGRDSETLTSRCLSLANAVSDVQYPCKLFSRWYLHVYA